jgi:hypothetical protein
MRQSEFCFHGGIGMLSAHGVVVIGGGLGEGG